jgi:hypothetical protein
MSKTTLIMTQKLVHKHILKGCTYFYVINIIKFSLIIEVLMLFYQIYFTRKVYGNEKIETFYQFYFNILQNKGEIIANM